MSKTIRAAVYYRMSTDKQEDSIERQKSQVEPLADRKSYQLVCVYTDEGIAGDLIARRKGFQQMLRDAQAGLFDCILCDDKDRFGRFDTIDLGEVVAPLRRKGVWLETCAQGRIDWNSFAGRITDAVLQEAKKIESQAISRRILTGLLLKAQRGEPPAGLPPYGLRITHEGGKRRYVLGPAYEVEVVRWIFDKVATCHWTSRQIAEELYQRGVAPPPGNGRGRTKQTKLWNPGTIRALLRNRAYVGDLVYNKVRQGKYSEYRDGGVSVSDAPAHNVRPSEEADLIFRENTHPAIIDRDTFQRAREVMARNQKKTTPKKPGEGHYILSKLLVCGKCGAYLTSLSDRGLRFYCCGSYIRLGKRACKRMYVHESVILDHVIRAVQAECLNPARLDELREDLRREVEETQAGRGEVSLLRQRIDELDRDIRQGQQNILRVETSLVPGLSATLAEWQAESDRLAGELKRLTSGEKALEKERLLRVAEEQLWKWRERIGSNNPEDVRALLLELVDRIEPFFVEKTKRKRPSMVFDLGIIYPRGEYSHLDISLK